MVESRHIIAVLTIIILALVYGYAITPREYPITPQNDPIIGDWLHTSPGGGYTYISINSSGEYDELSFSNIGPYGYRSELAPIHGNWTRQLNGTYNLVHNNGFIQVLNYSSSQDVIFSENYEKVIFSRFNSSANQ